MNKKKCPLCGSPKTRQLLRAGTWGIDWCRECTNAWTEPAPDGVRYHEKDFHAQFPYREVGELPGQWRRATMMQANLLTEFLPPEAAVLEIGCGEGLFLKELRRRGFTVRGIEPSLQASRRAREAGLDVTSGLFPHPKIGGPVHAAVMIQVLEHIRHPVEFLDEVHRVAAGGIALLVQTNWRGLLPRLQRQRWYAWVPEDHFWHFTPKGMSVLLSGMGWRILKMEYSSLHHGASRLSRVGAAIPGMGDQFHTIVRIPP